MITTDLQTVVGWTGARYRPPAGGDDASSVVFRGLSTDSRGDVAGTLFVALRGESFDGHDFAGAATRGGAVGLVVERAVEDDVAQVIVADSRRALGSIGSGWRARFSLPVLAVTGSNGKTTVKECIAAILRRCGPALATRGNLNNDIGVPLMLGELAPDTTAAVFELGANHPGEIGYLAGLVRPDVGVITNAAAAHLEGFGSIEGVARAKGELLAALPPDGVAVLPAVSEWTPVWNDLAGARRRCTFGSGEDGDVRVRSVENDRQIELRIGDATRDVSFGLAGDHNRLNAAAAAAAAYAAGIDVDTIVSGLADVQPVAGRGIERRGAGGSLLIDDSYNANPASFAAALAELARRPGRRWVVAGEMLELGGTTVSAHEDLGRAARAAGVEILWAFGPSAAHTCAGFGAGAVAVNDLDALAASIAPRLAADVSLLIKGSRGNRLERLVVRLLADGDSATGPAESLRAGGDPDAA